jgi:hypothetical protein
MHSYLGHHHSSILMIEAQFHLETIMMDWDALAASSAKVLCFK